MSYRVNTYGNPLDLAVLAPTIQASLLEALVDGGTFDDTFDETFHPPASSLVFTRGNGFRYLAIVSQNIITKLPKDGVTYPLGYVFPDGSYVIAKGSIPSIDISALSSGDWYVRVFEFNGSESIEKYNRDEAEDNPIQFTI